jgi:hypothetical protein
MIRRLGVAPDPAFNQSLSELARRQRLVSQQLAYDCREPLGIGPTHPSPERAVVAALDHVLDQRPQPDRIADRNEVNRSTHQL